MFHPWLQYYPIKKKSKYLILGTHPPMPYCGKLRFFYGNMSKFWRFLDIVYPDNNLYADWIKKSEVDVIYFTSFGGSNSAKSLFKKWYKKEFKKSSKITKAHINNIEIYKRKITLIDLFSPSPTARRSSGKIKEYINWLSENDSEQDYDSFRVYWYKSHLPNLNKIP